MTSVSGRSAESLRRTGTRSFLEGPETVRQLITALLLAWAAIGLVAVVVSLFGGIATLIGVVLFLAGTVVAFQQVLELIRAKRDVLSKKDVRILWGLGRLVAWDPVEGVLFLRNKELAFMDDSLDDGHGGIRCIYPILGDEVALRVPLETQTLEFADEEVLTREYLAVTIWGSMRWQIADLKQFYMQMSRELRATGELADRRQQERVKTTPGASADTTTSGRLMGTAIEWLRLLAEERTRTVVSRVSSGLLIAERLTDSVSATSSPGNEFARLSGSSTGVEGPQAPWRTATETLAQSIAETVADGVRDSGINVLRVSLQEIKLPPGIVQASRQAAEAAYLPLLSQRQASTKRADLEVEVDLLGKEVVGAREVIGAAPAFTLVDFLSQFVSKQVGGALGAGGAGLAAGMLAGGALAKEAEKPAPPAPNP